TGADGASWTTVRRRELRERLGIAAFDPTAPRVDAVTVDEAARRLSICVGSVHRLIREGALPATQVMPSAPWQIPATALDSDAVKIGVRHVIERCPPTSRSYRTARRCGCPDCSRGRHNVTRSRV